MTKNPNQPLRAVVYTRVSTGKQTESGLGLADQLAQTTAAVESRGWDLVHHAQDAGASGKSIKGRPALAAALDMLDKGEADVLVTAKLDRLSRSVVDFGKLMERATKRHWSVVCLDLGVDTSTAAGEMMANVVCAFAQYERKLISDRTRASHQVRRQRGQRAGQVPILPTEVRERIARESAEGRTLRAIAGDLNAEGVPTAKSGRWHSATVAHVVRSVALEKELAESAQAVAA